MEKEAFQLPAECSKCKQVYELNDDLIGEDWNRTLSDVLIEKFGDDTLLCPKCRHLVRIIEEGKFTIAMTYNYDDITMNLELISKDGVRRAWRVSEIQKNEITFKKIADD